ncbi:MAG TPA: glycerol-3-phosphate 1-O-acyltransferase PlsY [Thermoanaerobaculia bacterium]|nr:glycerol-3-phosphate 1-O-acyltransferase PlsY [Thermoanaerobaculia bacterium]
MPPLALIVISYLIGSIPFSFIVARLAAGADIRQEGSRNVGATNVIRIAGKLPGIIALLLDLAKGYAVIELARWMVSRPEWPFAASSASPIDSREMWIALAGLIAVLAHMFPVWLRLHGGKGVATAGGVFLALSPIVFAASMIVFLIVLISTRFVSLASIMSAISIPLFMRFLVHDTPFWRIVISVVIVVAVITKHHSNIARITQGTERRVGERKGGE